MTGLDAQAELDRAQVLFQDGRIIEAAEVLHGLRREADVAEDDGLRAEIDGVARQMRKRLFAELPDFDQVLREGRSRRPSPEERSARRRLHFWRLGLVVGAVGLFLAVNQLRSRTYCDDNPDQLAFFLTLLPAFLVGAAVAITTGRTSWSRWVAAILVTLTLLFFLYIWAEFKYAGLCY